MINWHVYKVKFWVTNVPPNGKFISLVTFRWKRCLNNNFSVEMKTILTTSITCNFLVFNKQSIVKPRHWGRMSLIKNTFREKCRKNIGKRPFVLLKRVVCINRKIGSSMLFFSYAFCWLPLIDPANCHLQKLSSSEQRVGFCSEVTNNKILYGYLVQKVL